MSDRSVRLPSQCPLEGAHRVQQRVSLASEQHRISRTLSRCEVPR